MSQEEESTKYIWFDSMVGQTNSGIFKGVAYDNEYRVVNGRYQFFADPNFVVGSVVFDQQSYFGVYLKYDVFHDNLLISNRDLVDHSELILEKEKVQTFQIGKHVFKNIVGLGNKNTKVSGYVEVLISSDSFSLYKEHKKKILKSTGKNGVYHQFKDINSFLIQRENIFHTIKSPKDLFTVFPEYRKLIKNSIQQYSTLKKSRPDEYMKSIANEILEVMKQNNSGQ
ncbi:MAG: hypothetical protein AB8B59_09660 [Maribacter sp.]